MKFLGILRITWDFFGIGGRDFMICILEHLCVSMVGVMHLVCIVVVCLSSLTFSYHCWLASLWKESQVSKSFLPVLYAVPPHSDTWKLGTLKPQAKLQGTWRRSGTQTCGMQAHQHVDMPWDPWARSPAMGKKPHYLVGTSGEERLRE